MAPELLLGGCYWPQSSGQRQTAKGPGSPLFPVGFATGFVVLRAISGSLGFGSVLTVPTSHPIYHGKGRGPTQLSTLFAGPGIPLQGEPASSHGCYLGMPLLFLPGCHHPRPSHSIQ